MEHKHYEKYLIWLVISCIDFFSTGMLFQIKWQHRISQYDFSLFHYTPDKQKRKGGKTGKQQCLSRVCVSVQDAGRAGRLFTVGQTWTGFNPQLTWLLCLICCLLTKWEWQPIRALILEVLGTSASHVRHISDTYVIPLESSSPVHSFFSNRCKGSMACSYLS